jgi:FixJ family two-component response regulator
MRAEDTVVAIVDDDEVVRRALKRLVRSLSFQATDFACGEAFLESIETLEPACALLDLQMPGLDGLEVLLAMRTRNLNIPTIVVTANAQPDMKARCLRAGAVAYLQKPLDRDVVLSAIRAATD